MTFLPTGNLAKLLLRDPGRKPFQPPKNLGDILQIQSLALGLANQLLDLDQALAVEMAPKALRDLLDHGGQEPLMLILARVEDPVDEPRLQQLLRADPLAHDERLVRLADAQAPHERVAGPAFGHQPERGEGREEEGVRGAVDEVRVRDQGGRETDDGPVERRDEDLGVRVEGVGDLEVVGDEVAQGLAADVGVWGGGAADGDVGAGGEVAACAGQDGDEDVVALGYLAHELGELVVEVLG